MKIAFCYDIEENHPLHKKVEDITAEYESSETIDYLSKLLGRWGEVVQLPWHPDIFYDLKKAKPDLVFNITEGWGSRNRESFLPNICEMLGIACTGSDGLALGVSLDKTLSKQIADSVGIRTPDFYKISTGRQLEKLLAEELQFPLFVKPNSEGSSIGIRKTARVTDRRQLQSEVSALLKKYQKAVLVEKFLEGREFAVAILGNESPQIFPVAEILVDQGQASFYSYEFKGAHNRIINCPAQIEDGLADQMIADTLKIFEALGCCDIARADFKLDERGGPNFMEINPLPGLSPFYSIYPLQAGQGGVELEQIIDTLVENALQRHKKE